MKIGIFTTNAAFLNHILEGLKDRGHEYLGWTQTGNVQIDWANVARIMDWCDVAFFEWCQTPFLEAMSFETPKCKIVLREHGLPFFSIYKTFPWNNVDLFIGAAHIFGERLKEIPPQRQPKRYVDAPMGSDPTFFVMPKNRQYGKRLLLHSTTIRFKKRVYTTIQTFYELLQRDSKWKLHIVGEWEQGYGAQWEGEQYTEPCKELMEDLGIRTKIELTPNMPLPQWRDYLADKDLFISNSIREGVQISLVEAMMCGVWPLVNCWRGADRYYPQECIFHTQTELVKKILAWSQKTNQEKTKLSEYARQWAVDHFDIANTTNLIMDEIEALAEEKKNV